MREVPELPLFETPPKPDNMGGGNRNRLSGGGLKPLSDGGLDTLEISLYGSWKAQAFENLRSELIEAQKRSQRGQDGDHIISPEGDVVNVLPAGVRKGVFCRFFCEWEGCRIAIFDGKNYHENRLSVHVSIGSVAFMRWGHQAIWDSVLRLLSSLGFELLRDVVGRCDICCDLADVGMDEIQSLVEADGVVCRARKGSVYFDRDSYQTYQMGRGAISVRIYDKVAETEHDPVKRSLLINRRWGRDCRKAVRVEFQLRGRGLKESFFCSSVEEVFAGLGGMAEYLTDDWFRLSDKAVDRKNGNQRLAKAGLIWRKVRRGFGSWCQGKPRRKKPRSFLAPDFKKLKAQAVGCLTTVAAHTQDWRSFVDYLEELKTEFLTKAETAIKEKRRDLAAKSRVEYDLADIPF